MGCFETEESSALHDPTIDLSNFKWLCCGWVFSCVFLLVTTANSQPDDPRYAKLTRIQVASMDTFCENPKASQAKKFDECSDQHGVCHFEEWKRIDKTTMRWTIRRDLSFFCFQPSLAESGRGPGLRNSKAKCPV
jgi:hypothetical protein